jgi:hypothetical protein
MLVGVRGLCVALLLDVFCGLWVFATAAVGDYPQPSAAAAARYMDKGRDCVEQGKLYARLLAALGKAGLRV